MEQWDTGFVLEGYIVQVKLKVKEGVYYAQADSFFLVAASGETLDEAMYNLKQVYLKVRDIVFMTLLKRYKIEKAP